jgi:plastocyanin
VTGTLAQIGSSDLIAAVIFGIPVAVGIVVILFLVPTRIGPLQILASLAVAGLLFVGLWAAFSSNPPAESSTPAIAAGGSGFAIPSPPPPATCTPTGGEIHLTAKNTSFDPRCLAARANAPFKVTLDNQDKGLQHNFELFTDRSAATRLGGAKDASDTVTGPGSVTYEVKALPPGRYFFHCDIHPTQMFGTFVVAS